MNNKQAAVARLDSRPINAIDEAERALFYAPVSPGPKIMYTTLSDAQVSALLNTYAPVVIDVKPTRAKLFTTAKAEKSLA